MMTFFTPKPITAIMAMARMMMGKAKSPSITRMMTASILPP
jgi:hypothetical protein